MGKIALKLNGKPFDLTPPEAPTVKKLKAFLDSAKEDDLFNPAGLAHATHTNVRLIREHLPALPAYTAFIGNSRYFGHPKAIAELKRQVNA